MTMSKKPSTIRNTETDVAYEIFKDRYPHKQGLWKIYADEAVAIEKKLFALLPFESEDLVQVVENYGCVEPGEKVKIEWI